MRLKKLPSVKVNDGPKASPTPVNGIYPAEPMSYLATRIPLTDGMNVTGIAQGCPFCIGVVHGEVKEKSPAFGPSIVPWTLVIG